MMGFLGVVMLLTRRLTTSSVRSGDAFTFLVGTVLMYLFNLIGPRIQGRVNAMVKVVSPISNREVDVATVDFEAKGEPWATYELSDGTIIKLRTTVAAISRFEGEHDAAGNPVYNVVHNTVIRVVSAPKELRGTPTGTGPQVGKSSTAGPEVR